MSWIEDWFERKGLPAEAEKVLGRLRVRRDRIIWDCAAPGELKELRRDVARIARGMERGEGHPPMFWSGIPLPKPAKSPSCDYHLVVSVGGTKTDFALQRLEGDQVFALHLEEACETCDGAAIHQEKQKTQMSTPKFGRETRSGLEMVRLIAGHIARHLRRHPEALRRCRAVLLSWGFAHAVVRTGPRLAGGLTAIASEMTKDQAGFSGELEGKDLGRLFSDELAAASGKRFPVAVANDTVMALHYFLGPRHRASHARVGLFINGTGTNFALAEPYAVRREGFISRAGEGYEPRRITARSRLRKGDRMERFFINYEAGSIELDATRTRFDTQETYSIERNALAGGNAFPQMFRSLIGAYLSPAFYEGIRRAWIRGGGPPGSIPGSQAVGALAGEGRGGAFYRDLALLGLRRPEAQLVARAIIARSALHVALILAAVTQRTGFGLGSDAGLPDLLGMEGSIWKLDDYPDLVRGYWRDLVGRQLHVDFAKEPSNNASLPGPLYLAALHP